MGVGDQAGCERNRSCGRVHNCAVPEKAPGVSLSRCRRDLDDQLRGHNGFEFTDLPDFGSDARSAVNHYLLNRAREQSRAFFMYIQQTHGPARIPRGIFLAKMEGAVSTGDL